MSKTNKSVTVHYGGVQNISVVFENVSLRGVEILLQEQCDKEKEE